MKNVMIAVVLSMFAVTAFACDHSKKGHKTHEQKSEQHMQKMTKKLELTEPQQQDIKTIHAEAKTKKESLDKQYNIDAYKKEKRAIGSDSRAKFEAVLTDDQKAKLQKMKKNHKHKKHD